MKYYKNILPKLIKLGKEKTPEGQTARHKALLIKYKHIKKYKSTSRKNTPRGEKGKFTSGNHNSYKHGFETAEARESRSHNNKKSWEQIVEEEAEVLNRMLRDMYAYNYHYVSTKQLPAPQKKESKMEVTYIPESDSCPNCDFLNEGFPQLEQIYPPWKSCYVCGKDYMKKDGKLIEIGAVIMSNNQNELKK